ncbi:MAG: pyruvate kinase [Dehalococcoidia bacterium]|nr:pyruvate kinase [Dehalococcoidia bacterium]
MPPPLLHSTGQRPRRDFPTRHTKIVATLGPASEDPSTIGAMIDAGLDVARLNTSHGMIEEHERFVAVVREVAASRDKPVAVLMDLGGPKLRTGPTEGGRPLNLAQGATIHLTPTLVKGDESRLTIDYPRLLDDVRQSDVILLDDGHIELEVMAVESDALRCRVTYGGLLQPNKGVAFPYSNLTMPVLTDRDREAIRAGARAGVDYFALSFVRAASDIEAAREAIDDTGVDIPVIAKIERRQAIQHLDEIVCRRRWRDGRPRRPGR